MVVNIAAWIRSCANTAVLALPEVETPCLAHHFYMPGIWKPVFFFIQCKYVTIYSKVCNKWRYLMRCYKKTANLTWGCFAFSLQGIFGLTFDIKNTETDGGPNRTLSLSEFAWRRVKMWRHTYMMTSKNGIFWENRYCSTYITNFNVI